MPYACKSMAKKPKMKYAENDMMIRREIQIRRLLSGQPNIVELKSAHEDETAVHVVMELCQGGDLFDRIIAKGYYSERDAAPVLRAIVNAVNVCHSMGVMHRDLKPENFCFISRDDNALLKVTDFGSALLFEEGKLYRDIVGSGFYIAPEVLRRRYGKEIDIWSAGVILYILLSGVPPFWAETKKGTYDAILQGEIDFETDPWPSISSTAKGLVRRMLTKDPKRRITAAQILEHPWLIEGGEASDDTSVILRMKQFRRMSKLKKLTVKVIVEYLPGEETQALKEKFIEMDTDKNGTLSYDELRAGLTKVGSMLTEFDVKQLMEAVKNSSTLEFILYTADMDGNGAIDYTEFTAATIQRQKLERSEYLSKAFQYFDKDNSGYITLDELVTAFKENNMGDDAKIKELLSDIDSNKDGMISYDEFRAMVESPQTIRNVSHIYTDKAKKFGLGNTKQFRAMNMLKKLVLQVIVENLPTEEKQKLMEKFREMDTDNSGTLTLSELKAGLAKLGSALEESEVNQYMEAGDIDGNGNIDFIEFVNLMTDIYKLETPELLEKAFQYLDKNSDQFITVNELETAFKENNMGDDATIKEIISEVGRDHKDGRISFDQFCAFVKGGSQLRAPTLGNLSYMLKGKGQKFPAE
ncbi:calcium-dependent protein kinase 9 [Citrus sinensis]|nr:calcium-dependent protein kinase 9 [Citrus sinensis]